MMGESEGRKKFVELHTRHSISGDMKVPFKGKESELKHIVHRELTHQLAGYLMNYIDELPLSIKEVPTYPSGSENWGTDYQLDVCLIDPLEYSRLLQVEEEYRSFRSIVQCADLKRGM